jgi:transcriptional regulator of acetoin/glycerol metabolism
MPLRWHSAANIRDLVQIASAEIDWLYDYIAKSGYALVLTDASGVVLYEKTDATLRTLSARPA